jgi:iron complex outermembrane receptor protein
MKKRPGRYLFLCATAAAMPSAGAAAAAVQDLSALSIEELAQVEVQSASKRAEPVSAAPTSIYVITGDDILRSSATSLPELLRDAPNLQVQRIDAREYSITARGFSGYDNANKLLVRIDGRSIYSTLHSGVFWELHNPLLEDLRQVEVISGPGGTLYGTNAVNGIINISSKDAADTIGGLVRGSAGGRERNAAARYGFALGEGGAVRVYGSYFDREDLPAGTTRQYDDGFDGFQTGFRGDFDRGRDHFTVQGDLFRQWTRLLDGDGNRGHNLLARWRRQIDQDAAFELQAYYDDYRRRYITVRDALETFDAEAQYNHRLGMHDLVVGLGIRTTRDNFFNGLGGLQLDPQSARLWFFNAFVQDRIALTPNLSATLGLKLERSSFTGLEVLPNVRLAWQPRSDALFWAAVSRAVRTPSRADRELVGLPLLAKSVGFESEKLLAVEGGYRGQLSRHSSLSLSFYYNRYGDIRSTELTNGGLPIQLRNGIRGHSYGLEAWGTQQLARWWRVSAGANLLGKSFRPKAGVTDIGAMSAIGRDPNYQLMLRSQMDLGDRFSLDIDLRAVDGLKGPVIPAYAEANARLGYRLTDRLELFVAGNNLLHDRHLESNDTDQGQAVPRILYAGARIRF